MDKKTNIWIRDHCKVTDIHVLKIVKERKRTCAGHMSRVRDNRWTAKLTDWRPRDGKRSRRWPSKRWRADLDSYWTSVAWKEHSQETGSSGSNMPRPSSNKWIDNGYQ